VTRVAIAFGPAEVALADAALALDAAGRGVGARLAHDATAAAVHHRRQHVGLTAVPGIDVAVAEAIAAQADAAGAAAAAGAVGVGGDGADHAAGGAVLRVGADGRFAAVVGLLVAVGGSRRARRDRADARLAGLRTVRSPAEVIAAAAVHRVVPE